MTTFGTSRESRAVVAATAEQVWEVLSDGPTVARLTPLLRRIDVDGDLWRWHLMSVGALGVQVAPVFTEAMVLQPPHRIDFTHQPPAGTRERAGADGWYLLEEVEDGTALTISLRVHVELPLSRLAAPAVRPVMDRVLTRMGDGFAANLREHLRVAT